MNGIIYLMPFIQNTKIVKDIEYGNCLIHKSLAYARVIDIFNIVFDKCEEEQMSIEKILLKTFWKMSSLCF